MNISCKDIDGFFYFEKYISGGKGKCIFYNNLWLTPNQFEKMVNSRSKKYKCSLKNNGKPLYKTLNIIETELSASTDKVLNRKDEKIKVNDEIEEALDVPISYNLVKDEFSKIQVNTDPDNKKYFKVDKFSIGNIIIFEEERYILESINPQTETVSVKQLFKNKINDNYLIGRKNPSLSIPVNKISLSMDNIKIAHLALFTQKCIKDSLLLLSKI